MKIMPVRVIAMSCLALLVASCAAPAAPPSPAQPAADQSPTPAPLASGDVIYARAADPAGGLLVIDVESGKTIRTLPWGAVAPDWSVIYRAENASGGTAIRAYDVATGAMLRERVINGPYVYDLPTVGMVGEPAGLSPNGQWLAVRARVTPGPYWETKSAFAVVDTQLLKASTTVELAGDFGYDALANSGSALFLEEYLSSGHGGAAGYHVRAYNLASGALEPGVIADKGTSGDMTGTRAAAIASRDGQWIFSLYTRPDKPFVHALNVSDRYSVCLFLPTGKSTNGEDEFAWQLVPSPDGKHAYAVNVLKGVIAEIDLAGLKITRSTTFTVASEEPSPIERLARLVVPIAEAKAEMFSQAIVSPDGKTLYALNGFDGGILRIALDTLAVIGRFGALHQFTGLGMSGDGERLYTIDGNGGMLLRMNARSGDIVSRVSFATNVFRILRVTAR